jgi:uncharacterized membrane protein YdjX (TVP38/TMEM64 family)
VSVRLRLALLGAVLAVLVLVFALTGSLSPGKVRDWMDGYGAAGPLVFIVVSSCLTPTLFPGPLLAGAAGLLFGTALGWPVAVLSATLGAALAFSLARWWAHDAVAELAGPRVLALEEFVSHRGFLSVLYARLAPGLPYSLVNYAAGLTRMPLRAFAAATALGTAPRTFAYVALGGQFGSFSSWQTIAAVAVLAVMAVTGIELARRDPEIRAALARVRGAGAARDAGRGAGGAATGGPAPAASGPGTGSSSPDGRSAAPR